MARPDLHVAIIGAQTAQESNGHTQYTVYQTVVTHKGECHERLLRYRQFRGLQRKLKSAGVKDIPATFPSPKWTRKASLSPHVIEERRVLLDEYMEEVCRKELPPSVRKYLMELLELDAMERATTLKPAERSQVTESKEVKEEGQVSKDKSDTSDGKQPDQVVDVAVLVNSTCPLNSMSSTADTTGDLDDDDCMLDSFRYSDGVASAASSQRSTENGDQAQQKRASFPNPTSRRVKKVNFQDPPVLQGNEASARTDRKAPKKSIRTSTSTQSASTAEAYQGAVFDEPLSPGCRVPDDIMKSLESIHDLIHSEPDIPPVNANGKKASSSTFCA